MKKILCIILVILVITVCNSFAESLDLGSMTIQELMDARNAIEAEILARLDAGISEVEANQDSNSEGADSSNIESTNVVETSVVSEEDAEVLYAGKYHIGSDFSAGQYAISCTEVTGGAYGKIAVYANEDTNDSMVFEYLSANKEIIYVNLKDGMLMKAYDGTFSIWPIAVASGLPIYEGIYHAGDDIDAGKYVIKCNTVTDGAYMKVAVYKNEDDYNSSNSVIFEYMSSDDYQYINLTEGMIFQIFDGYGTIESTSAEDEIKYSGLYYIGSEENADLSAGSYLITCNAIADGAYMKIAIYDSEEEYESSNASTFEYLSRDEQMRFTLNDGAILSIIDGTAQVSIID